MYATTDPTGGLTSGSPPPHAGKSRWLHYGDDGACDIRCGRVMPSQNDRAIESGMSAAAEANAVLRTQA